MQRPSVFKPRVSVAAFALAGLATMSGVFSNLRSFLAGRGGVVDLAFAVGYVLLGGWLAFAFCRRHRPVLEIHGTQLRHGRSYWPGRSVVDLGDVEEVRSVPGWRKVLALRLRSGKTVRISIREVRPEEREEVVRIIEERVGGAGPGEGPPG